MEPTPSKPGGSMKAGPGMHVVVELHITSGVERLEFDLVPDPYADFEAGFLGTGTPLGKAILGLSAGQSRPYKVGDSLSVTVVSVEQSSTPPPKEVAERRQETIRRAIEDSDRTNAMIFASSFSGKWGDYDPTGFSAKDDPQGDEE